MCKHSGDEDQAEKPDVECHPPPRWIGSRETPFPRQEEGDCPHCREGPLGTKEEEAKGPSRLILARRAFARFRCRVLGHGNEEVVGGTGDFRDFSYRRCTLCKARLTKFG